VNYSHRACRIIGHSDATSYVKPETYGAAYLLARVAQGKRFCTCPKACRTGCRMDGHIRPRSYYVLFYAMAAPHPRSQVPSPCGRPTGDRLHGATLSRLRRGDAHRTMAPSCPVSGSCAVGGRRSQNEVPEVRACRSAAVEPLASLPACQRLGLRLTTVRPENNPVGALSLVRPRPGVGLKFTTGQSGARRGATATGDRNHGHALRRRSPTHPIRVNALF
jgi:hypothetical protein